MEKRVIRYEEEVRYVAEDGKTFSSERKCLAYEKYCNTPVEQLLSPYLNFETWKGKPWEGQPWEIDFNTCVVLRTVPDDILDFIEAMDYPHFSTFAQALKFRVEEPELLYHNCNDLYNGGSQAKWEHIGNINNIKVKIKRLTEYAESLEKLSKKA